MEMDSDVRIMFFVKNSQFLTKDKMTACLHKNFNRKNLPDEYEKEIHNVWRSRIDKNPKLYNGTKFRLNSVNENKDGSLTVNIGVTCYKEYLGTNWATDPKCLQDYGLKTYQNPQACLSDPLGVGSFLLTSDNHIILLRRSMHCGEAAGMWDIPGGHAEPEEIVGKKKFEEIDLNAMSPGEVVDEIYASIVREIRDEVNIPETSLSEPALIGIAYNTASASRPSMEFIIKCERSTSEILSLYKQGIQAEAEESTNIKFIPLDEVVRLEENDKKFWNSLAPSAKGCLILYRLATNQYDIQKLS